MSREELEKLTATKLREVAKEHSEIQGATAMKKEDLVVAILKARGEPIKVVKKDTTKISDVKKVIRKVKEAKEKAIAEKDAKKAAELRKQLKKLKRQTRELAGDKKKPVKEKSA